MWGALRKTFGSLKSILERRLVEDRVTMATAGINTSWLGAHLWGWKLCLSPSLGWTFKFAFSKYHVPLKGFVVPRDCLETQEVFLENHQPWIRLLSQGPSAPPIHMTSSSGVHLRPQLARIVPDYPGSIVSSTAGILLACWLTSHSTSRISLMCIRGEDHGHFCSLPSHRDAPGPPDSGDWCGPCICHAWRGRWPQTLVSSMFLCGPVPLQRRERLSTQGSLTHPSQSPRQICEPI